MINTCIKLFVRYCLNPKALCLWVLTLSLGGLAAEAQSINHFALEAAQSWLNESPQQDYRLLWRPEINLDIFSVDTGSIKASLSSQSQYIPANLSPGISTKLYRAWISADYHANSVRIGLQRLNFGTASLIRPMQWFDRLNPLDKSEETEGVKAIVTNFNLGAVSRLQIWTVLGEDRPKGNESFASKEDAIEPGARLELPLGRIQTGLAYHTRKLEQTALVPDSREHRLGLDLRWDGLFGLWLESSASLFDHAVFSPIPELNLSYGMGADYTFGVGNGLYLRQETALFHSSPADLSALKNQKVITAVMGTYPLGLLDQAQVLCSADWKAQDFSAGMLFSRYYDYWGLSLGLSHTFAKGSHPTIDLKLS